MTQTKEFTKDKELAEYGQLLMDAGFTIIAPVEPSTWFHFYKDGNFGYVQYEKWRGYSFSSTHKPCRECGTGFGIHDDISNPTVKMAEDSFIFAPRWASHKQCAAIKKYSSIEEFIKKSYLEYRVVNPS